MPKFGTKNALFDCFWLKFKKKTNVIFEISTLGFVKSECLTHTVNFLKESSFSKGLGSVFSTFSEVPGPRSGPGLICKVWLIKNASDVKDLLSVSSLHIVYFILAICALQQFIHFIQD